MNEKNVKADEDTKASDKESSKKAIHRRWLPKLEGAFWYEHYGGVLLIIAGVTFITPLFEVVGPIMKARFIALGFWLIGTAIYWWVARGYISNLTPDPPGQAESPQTDPKPLDAAGIVAAIANANRPRADILTNEWRARIADTLRKLPSEQIGLVKCLDTAEAAELSEVIQELLRVTGRLGHVMEMSGFRSNQNPPGRLVLRPLSPDGEKAAQSLAANFRDAGIPDVTVDAAKSGITLGTFLQITVKPK